MQTLSPLFQKLSMKGLSFDEFDKFDHHRPHFGKGSFAPIPCLLAIISSVGIIGLENLEGGNAKGLLMKINCFLEVFNYNTHLTSISAAKGIVFQPARIAILAKKMYVSSLKGDRGRPLSLRRLGHNSSCQRRLASRRVRA